MSKHQYDNGIFGVFASEKNYNDRLLQDDNTLKFLGGMVARDQSKRPQWYDPMMRAVPDGCTLAYVGPTHPDNKSAMMISNGVTFDSCLGIWCLQFASPTSGKYESTVRAFLDHGILNSGGWAQIEGTKIFRRYANPGNREPWWEYLEIRCCPPGAISGPLAEALENQHLVSLLYRCPHSMALKEVY